MKNILITDDEKSFLVSLKEGLGGEKGAYQILTAEHGEQAIEQMESEHVDLLITDLRMPVMDGYELLAWVSTHRPELPVIVMTAFGDSELEARLEQYNTFRCLEKPLDFAMLREIVKTALADSTVSNIHGVSLSTFLQLMSFEKKNCTLIIRSEQRMGNLYLKNGELINADYEDTDGMAAATEILGWDNTEIEMDHVCKRDDVLISAGIESILLEVHQLKEEQGVDVSSILDTLERDRPDDDLITNIDEDAPDAPAGGDYFEEPFDDEPVLDEIEEEVPEHIKESLVSQLSNHKATEECCLFNHQNILEDINTRKQCTQVDFDPAIFLFLTGQLEQLSDFGDLKWINFTVGSRSHYLFFKLSGCSVLIRLIRGARPQLLGAEYLNIIDKVMSNH